MNLLLPIIVSLSISPAFTQLAAKPSLETERHAFTSAPAKICVEDSETLTGVLEETELYAKKEKDGIDISASSLSLKLDTPLCGETPVSPAVHSVTINTPNAEEEDKLRVFLGHRTKVHGTLIASNHQASVFKVRSVQIPAFQ